MLKVGLTGGIGSGKSAVAARLASLGAVIVDADRIAREVVAPGTEGLREIVATFGDRVLAADGGLDRPALGAIVFGDDDARTRLEAITHPRVAARTAQLVAAAPADAIVVNDVPLLVEVGRAPTYHLVIVVETTEAIRVERLVRDRGMTTEQAYQRIRAQTSDARRRAVADVLLTNDGDLDDLHAAVDALWRDRLIPYERNVRERRPVRANGTARSDSNPTRRAEFLRLAARIGHAVGRPDARIERADPTAALDLELTVPPPADADALADRLAEAGFPRYPGTRLHGSADPGRPVRLRVRLAGSSGDRPGGPADAGGAAGP